MSVAVLYAPIVADEEDYITLAEAARRAGYASPSALRMAALRGKLRVRRYSPRIVMTTPQWLNEYLNNLSGEGRPRSGSGDDAETGKGHV